MYQENIVWVGRMNMDLFNNLREKFSPAPGFEPGSPAISAGALTNWATQMILWAKLEFFSY